MLSIMLFCPKIAAEGHANICVQDNKKVNPIKHAHGIMPVLSHTR
jgi:hypothetical protein